MLHTQEGAKILIHSLAGKVKRFWAYWILRLSSAASARAALSSAVDAALAASAAAAC